MTRESDELATIGQRGAAAVIDWLGLLALATIMTVPFATQGPDGQAIPNRWAYLAWVIVVALIATISVARWGQTPGKRFLRIKVVSVIDGQNPTMVKAFLRIAPVVTALVLVPYPFYLAVVASLDLTALTNEQRRSLLDRMADTVVVLA